MWHLLQPPDIVRACPELDAPLLGGRLVLRNPTLLPFQLLGVAVGFRGARNLFRARQRPPGARGPEAAGAAAAGGTYFAWSLLFFGLMNVSSIVCHGLMSDRTPAWEWAGVVDVVSGTEEPPGSCTG